MMFRTFTFLAVLMMSQIVMAKEISFSFDDAPTGTAYFSGYERTEKLIRGLSQSSVVDVAIFVVGNHIRGCNLGC